MTAVVVVVVYVVADLRLGYNRLWKSRCTRLKKKKELKKKLLVSLN